VTTETPRPPLAVEVAADRKALAELAADRVAAWADEAIRERGRFTLAVSGSSTPGPMFSALAERRLPWNDVHLFQVDERVAPEGDPDRNFADLSARLVERVPIPKENVHPMPVTVSDLGVGAEAYAAELAEVTGDGVLDLVHLGLGDDGHTASWPPGDPVANADGEGAPDVAVVGPFNGRMRMTLTPRAVNRSRRILWLVDGAAKAPVVARLLAGAPAIPASRVRTDRALLLASADAAPSAGA
jgi:6-phosphogluconolactonase